MRCLPLAVRTLSGYTIEAPHGPRTTGAVPPTFSPGSIDFDEQYVYPLLLLHCLTVALLLLKVPPETHRTHCFIWPRMHTRSIAAAAKGYM